MAKNSRKNKSIRNKSIHNNLTNKTVNLSKQNKTAKNKFVYSTEHYHSNDGMLTSVWGPSTWHLLHTMSFNYPVNPTCDDKSNYMNFILSLHTILPCGKCRANLKKNFKN
jgi:hypothetical protein